MPLFAATAGGVPASACPFRHTSVRDRALAHPLRCAEPASWRPDPSPGGNAEALEACAAAALSLSLHSPRTPRSRSPAPPGSAELTRYGPGSSPGRLAAAPPRTRPFFCGEKKRKKWRGRESASGGGSLPFPPRLLSTPHAAPQRAPDTHTRPHSYPARSPDQRTRPHHPRFTHTHKPTNSESFPTLNTPTRSPPVHPAPRPPPPPRAPPRSRPR